MTTSTGDPASVVRRAMTAIDRSTVPPPPANRDLTRCFARKGCPIMGNITQRPAKPGELCTCGRQAIVVYLGSKHGPTGYCGRGDGGDRRGPCPFCGGPRHQGRCPHYRLRLAPKGDRRC